MRRWASCNFSFTLSDVDIGTIEFEDEKLGPKFRQVYQQNLNAKKVIKDYLIKQLTEPFKYTHNLLGKNAWDFFQSSETFQIQAHRLGDTAILFARRLG